MTSVAIAGTGSPGAIDDGDGGNGNHKQLKCIIKDGFTPYNNVGCSPNQIHIGKAYCGLLLVWVEHSYNV